MKILNNENIKLHGNFSTFYGPILADPFKVVKKSNSIPDGYKIGIHEFGTYHEQKKENDQIINLPYVAVATTYGADLSTSCTCKNRTYVL